MNIDPQLLFDDVIDLPDPAAAERYASLVGLDSTKDRLLKEARLLLRPELLEDWSNRHYGKPIGVMRFFKHRAPLFIFGGDVGTGKTSLAESFGDPIARAEKISVVIYRLSLSARGVGAVGEMTRLLTAAFAEVREATKKATTKSKKHSTAAMLIIDEADSLTQSREFAQMHHEDRAGVNAIIRGIDNLAVEELPVLVVMCTNRPEAIDPAITRRAAAIFEFSRPNEAQRIQILEQGFSGTGFTQDQIISLAKSTGPTKDRAYGFTYSDLVRRLLPSLLLDAFPDNPITFDRATEITHSIVPTTPFQEANGTDNT